MRKCPVTKDFSCILRRVSFASFLLKLVAVPVGLVQARLLSGVVLSATAGDFYGVLKKGAVIILLLLAVRIFEFVTQTAYQKAKANALHKCKLHLYRQYLLSPMSQLYDSSAGQAAVIFQNDFNTLTDLITEVRPGGRFMPFCSDRVLLRPAIGVFSGRSGDHSRSFTVPVRGNAAAPTAQNPGSGRGRRPSRVRQRKHRVLLRFRDAVPPGRQTAGCADIPSLPAGGRRRFADTALLLPGLSRGRKQLKTRKKYAILTG